MPNRPTRAAAIMAMLATFVLAPPSRAGEVKIALIEPGAEPREVVVFKPVVGQAQYSRLVVKSSKEMSAPNGQRMSMDMPTLVLEMGSEVVSVADTGIATVRETLHDTEVRASGDSDPQMASMFSELYTSLKGMKSDAEIKPNGERTQTAVTGNPAGGGGIGDMTASFGVYFPSEPIGVGAKWKASTVVQQQGLRLDMDYDFELLRRDGDKLEITVVIEGGAPAQVIQVPNLAPGQKAEILSASMSGLGTVQIDLARANPVSASQSLSNDTKVRISDAQQSMEMDQRIKMDQRIEEIAKPGPKASEAKNEKPTPKPAGKPKAGKKPKTPK